MRFPLISVETLAASHLLLHLAFLQCALAGILVAVIRKRLCHQVLLWLGGIELVSGGFCVLWTHSNVLSPTLSASLTVQLERFPAWRCRAPERGEHSLQPGQHQ